MLSGVHWGGGSWLPPFCGQTALNCPSGPKDVQQCAFLGAKMHPKVLSWNAKHKLSCLLGSMKEHSEATLGTGVPSWGPICRPRFCLLLEAKACAKVPSWEPKLVIKCPPSRLLKGTCQMWASVVSPWTSVQCSLPLSSTKTGSCGILCTSCLPRWLQPAPSVTQYGRFFLNSSCTSCDFHLLVRNSEKFAFMMSQAAVYSRQIRP